MVKASDWEAEGTRFNSWCAQGPEIWILPHPEMEVLGSFGDGEWDSWSKVKKIWGEIEKCLYYHYVAEQIMWVPGSGSWVFGEIGGLRKCWVGVEKCRFLKMPGSIFARSGQSRLAFFDTYVIQILNFSKLHFSVFFRILYWGRRHERSH